VAERVARRLDGTESCCDRVFADDGIISRGVQHDNVRSQLRGSSISVANPGRGEEALNCVHRTNDDGPRSGTRAAVTLPSSAVLPAMTKVA